ncbi:hypothetical protein FIBSPDRAFT_968867 [Athelia psychrophila]|uniref:Uncharacterized protein n=1 Tax=Athelia psychrophila TaxID=1759441 RepID=A0A167U4Q0_9AGAM|nr:hypothetical protein FIBSPDRAFT_968867 [Fibularhizoctonia sp. CBS 109695]
MHFDPLVSYKANQGPGWITAPHLDAERSVKVWMVASPTSNTMLKRTHSFIEKPSIFKRIPNFVHLWDKLSAPQVSRSKVRITLSHAIKDISLSVQLDPPHAPGDA